MTEELQEFIEANRDARELKRGISVQMYLEGYKHREIKDILGVGSGYIQQMDENICRARIRRIIARISR